MTYPSSLAVQPAGETIADEPDAVILDAASVLPHGVGSSNSDLGELEDDGELLHPDVLTDDGLHGAAERLVGVVHDDPHHHAGGEVGLASTSL